MYDVADCESNGKMWRRSIKGKARVASRNVVVRKMCRIHTPAQTAYNRVLSAFYW